MDILLVAPINNNFSGPQLGILYIATYLSEKTKYDIRIIDMNVEKIRDDFRYDANDIHNGNLPQLSLPELKAVILKEKPKIVAVTATTMCVNEALKVIDLAKDTDKGILTVIGGAHACAVEETLFRETEHLDVIALGEGEDTFLELAERFIDNHEYTNIAGTIVNLNGKIIKNPPRALRKDLDYYPFPNRDLVPIKRYLNPARIISSRGCPFNCVFCLRKVLGRSWRARSPKNVVDEIELLYKKYGFREFTFADDNFSLDKQRVMDICNEIIERKLKITWVTGTGLRADSTNEEMLKLMAKAGCLMVGAGIESGSQRILDNIDKKESLEDMLNFVRMAARCHLFVHGSFTIGNPGETFEDVRKSIEFAKVLIDNGLNHMTWNVVTPYPGTKLWDYIEKEGVFLSRDYCDYYQFGDEPVFETDEFTKEQRIEAISLARNETAKHLEKYRLRDFVIMLRRTALRFYSNPIDTYKSVILWSYKKAIGR